MYNEFSKKENINIKLMYCIGAAIGLLSTVLTMILFSAVLLVFNIDREYAAPFATVCVAVGGFFGSCFTAKKIGDRGYLIGLIVGITIFVLITILSLIFGNGFSVNTLFHFIIIVLASIAGGISGVNIANKHKKYI